MTEENPAQRHRRGKVWRDSDGNIIEPLLAKEWRWIVSRLLLLVVTIVLVAMAFGVGAS